MKKITKTIAIIVLTIFGLLLIDTIQAKAFNNSPLFKLSEEYNSNIILRTDKGIFVETCYCANGEVHTYFKWNPYICPVKSEEFPTN